jgi:DNA-binding CsgD family transcriptional regulator
MREESVELMARVVEHANAAPTDPSRWDPLVQDLTNLFAARSSVLFTPEPAADASPLGVCCGDLAAGVAEYFANWAHEDAWLKAKAGERFFQQAGEARFTREFLADEHLRKTAFFNDWARHYAAEQGLALKVTGGDGTGAPDVHLTLFRRQQDDPFNEADRSTLRRLWPTLQRAIQARWALRSVGPLDRALEETLNVMPTPTWLVRADARVDFANAAAVDLVRAGLWAQEHSGRLQSIGHLDGDALRLVVCRGAGSSGCHEAVSVFDRRQGRLLRGTLRGTPIANAALYAQWWPHARLLLMLERPTLDVEGGQWLAHVASRFDLTGAQCLVLDSLSRGLKVKDIALARSITPGTVRAHVHELLSKTGLSTQADLVRLALGG